MNPFVFDEQKTTVASLADKGVMHSSAFANEWSFENKTNRPFGKTIGATRRGSAPMFIYFINAYLEEYQNEKIK